MDSPAKRAERIALAILAGNVTDRGDAFADLRIANREAEVERDVQAVTAFRAGHAPWSVPVKAPWSGF